MLTNHRLRNRVLALAALTVLVGLPELAFAQQSGLFPNAPIRRQRTPCDHEDSIYSLYKHQYYGYYPTCWRKFPDGWGCPNSEAPDKAASFKEIPRRRPEPPADDNDADDMAKPGQNDEMEAPANGRKPGDPSPFDLPSVPDEKVSPFEPINPGGNPPADKPANPPQTNNRPGGPNAPDIAAPSASRTSRYNRSRVRDDGDDRPMLTASDEVVSESESGSRTVTADMTEESLRPVADAPLPSTQPTATPAPARRGVISGLFGNGNWSWRRR